MLASVVPLSDLCLSMTDCQRQELIKESCCCTVLNKFWSGRTYRTESSSFTYSPTVIFNWHTESTVISRRSRQLLLGFVCLGSVTILDLISKPKHIYITVDQIKTQLETKCYLHQGCQVTENGLPKFFMTKSRVSEYKGMCKILLKP